ncbi:hypothetical protein PM082_006627 [Marasmius tenuissimus]|nr:hypothetical protein PM082_006627 [Marasmius tenuissimus]
MVLARSLLWCLESSWSPPRNSPQVYSFLLEDMSLVSVPTASVSRLNSRFKCFQVSVFPEVSFLACRLSLEVLSTTPEGLPCSDNSVSYLTITLEMSLRLHEHIEACFPFPSLAVLLPTALFPNRQSQLDILF